MRSNLFDILILGLLVLVFGAIYRKRATMRLRFWIAGWFFILAHFAVQLPNFASERVQELQVASSLCGLLLAGVCFVLASSASRLSRGELAVVATMTGIPSLTYIFLVSFGFSAIWPLAVLTLAGESATVWLGRKFLPDTRIVSLTNTIAAAVCGGWLMVLIFRRQADLGVYAILTQFFLVNAVLFWNDFRRRSAGVITASGGLIAWACVFPVALTLFAFWPQLKVPPEFWNVPKYFVEFGMILTLMENQIYAAQWQREQYRLLFDSNPHPLFIYDVHSFKFLSVNQAAVEQYGYEQQEFLGKTVFDLQEVAALPGIERMLASSNGAIRTVGPWVHRRKDGSEFHVEMSSHAIEFEGRAARLCLAQDVTERQRLHEQLVHRAHHDVLTNLPNRLLFEERMLHTIETAARYGHKAAILCIDLDKFKEVNDSHGHTVGDACLQEVAARLMARLRESDTVARVGGEEFAIVIGELYHSSDAEKVASDLLSVFRRGFTVSDIELPLAASIGIAIYPDHGTEPTQLWHAADLAMYHAKYSGGDRCSMVTGEVEQLQDRVLARPLRGTENFRSVRPRI